MSLVMFFDVQIAQDLSYSSKVRYQFYCMKTRLKPITKLRQSYQRTLQAKVQVHPIPLNMSLLFNPFLKQEEYFRAISHQCLLYNKRIANKQISDQYEVRCFEKLFTIMAQIGNMDARDDQLNRLKQTYKWWNEQRRIIKQRKELGVVKYKTDRNIEKLRQYRTKMNSSQMIQPQPTLLNQKRFIQMFPYDMEYRTVHKQMDVPIKRLSEYKRKIININDNLYYQQDHLKLERVNYPKPKKRDPVEEQQQSLNLNPENIQPQVIQNIQTIANASSINPNPQNPNPQNPAPQIPQTENQPVQDTNQQDLGGFGEQPGQPEQEAAEEQVQDDKLAPKNKIYSQSLKQRERYQKQKSKDPYLFYKSSNTQAERRMEERSFLRQQYSLQVHREQKQFINRAHQWAFEKSKIQKQLQKKLEMMAVKNKFSISYEEPQKGEMISPADQRKYGFPPPKNFSNNKTMIVLESKLPEINQFRPIEKQIRRDRLKSLKNKFSSILNLKSEQVRQSVQTSLCQKSPRQRNFSLILQQHSLQKERDRELQQIQRIKQNLGKQRINVNIRTLAQALVPDCGDYKLQKYQSPQKTLPSNPFLVETKKKKKK